MKHIGKLLLLALALLMATTGSVGSAVDQWLTRIEVAKRLRVPEKTLAQWGSQGKGPRYSRFGRHCRYRLSDVIAWEERQSSGGDAA
jgi:hypothetical protein